MADSQKFDVVIVGGSYAGLAAALALGRSLRSVLIIDSGNPCNRQTPHSHNFLTQDGVAPGEISAIATAQVLKYATVKWLSDLVVDVINEGTAFVVTTQADKTFRAKKLLFATGLKDHMPEIPGFAACWGVSVLHCPYCHGYEVKHQHMGILANGGLAFELCRLIYNWSQKITLLTNGAADLDKEQRAAIGAFNIDLIEQKITALNHDAGMMREVVFEDGNTLTVSTIFSRVAFTQQCTIPEALGCMLNEQGFIVVDDFQRTNVTGVYAAGDNANMFRSVAIAVAAGTKAGAVINKELIEEGCYASA